MDKVLVLVGCGGFCVEIVVYLKAFFQAAGTEPPTLGFYDQQPEACRYQDVINLWGEGGFLTDSLAELNPDKHQFLVAIGDPIRRRALYSKCLAIDLVPFTLVHPSAQVCVSAKIGPGSIICPYVYVGPYVQLGPNVVMNTYASAGHDSTIGPSSVLSPYSCLNGSASCGESAFMGTSSSISPSRSLGAYSKLSAGSVLSSNTEECVLAIGNPARHRVMFRSPQ